MARQDRSARTKPQDNYQQKQMRRGQIIMAVFSMLIILSLILSAVMTW